MQYSIFRNNLLVASPRPDDSSELIQKKQSEDYITLNFTLVNYVDFQIGDYIVFAKTSQRYYLNKKPRVTEAPKEYKYECIFEGLIHTLQKTKVLLITPKVGGGSYTDYKFPLTGNAQTFLQFIVDNLNRNGGSYTAGTYKQTSTVTVDFNNWNVFEAISELSTQLNFSWYLQGTVLNFDEKGTQQATVLQVGRNAGLVSLTRQRLDNVNIATVVYGYGSTKNLPPRTADTGATYDGDLLTENRLSFVGVDGESKLVQNVNLYGRFESVQEFENIQPEFTGTVKAIPDVLTAFIDTTILFDVNSYLLPGITPKITFLTGKLIGLTFNITFEEVTKKITMDTYTDESGVYPNDLIFATDGDTYKLFDIYYPEAYITEAQTRLQTAVQEYLTTNCKPQEQYEANVDEEFLRANNVEINIGDVFRIISGTFNIDNGYEIKEITQNITNPYKYTIKFGDVILKSLLSLLKINTFKTDQSIYNISKNSVTNNQVTNIIGGDTSWQTL